MIKRVQKDGYYYLLDDGVIVDINVSPGTKTVKFEDGFSIELMDIMKQFPSVKELVIGSGIRQISISNFMFPNVRAVKSSSVAFQSGKSLVNRHGTLLNAFCLEDNEYLAYAKKISAYALEGCRTKIECMIEKADEMEALKGSADLLAPCDGPKIIQNTLVSLDGCREELYLPSTVRRSVIRLDFRGIKKIRIAEINELEHLQSSCTVHELVIEKVDRGDLYFLSKLKDYMPHLLHFERISIAENPYLKTEDGILYSKDGKILIWCPSGREGTVRIPEGVVRISPCAFIEGRISEVILPDSLRYIGDKAFYFCENLTHVDFGSGIEQISGKFIFSNCRNLEEISFPSQIREIGEWSFRNCSQLRKLQLNDGLRIIGDLAFGGTELKKVSIPGTVEHLGDGAFPSQLEDVVVENIPNGLIQAICRTERDEPFSTVTVSNGEKKFFLPKNLRMEAIARIDTQMNILGISGDYVDFFYEHASDPVAKRFTAIKAYQETGSEEIGKYVKRSARYIIDSFVENNMENELIDFLKLGLVSDDILDEFFEDVRQKGMVSASACILSMKKHTAKTFRV